MCYFESSFTSCMLVCFMPLVQEEAGSLLVNLSSYLCTITIQPHERRDEDVVQAATPIVEAASNILNVSSNVWTEAS